MDRAPPPIGSAVRRVEDPRFITGSGSYVGDLDRDDMLYATFVRSYLGHAHVTNISTDAAKDMPGVAGVYSPLDLPEIHAPLPVTFPQPGAAVKMPRPLESETVRHVGEAVAVVCARTRYQAADAAEAVDVDYKPLDAVVDPETALTSGAPLVHPDLGTNEAGSTQRAYGDIEKAFERAPVIIRERFSADRAAGASIEPRAILAEPGEGGSATVTLWDSTQAPFAIRRLVAEALELPPDAVRVATPDVGGAFGPKGRLYPEEIILAALCLRLAKPILWEATRSEDFATTYQGRGLVAEAELAATSDGTILGLRVTLTQDCGAYLPTGFIVAQNTAQHLLGPYRIPACRFDIKGVYTNKAPLTPLRGGGRELGVFVIERLMDRLAHETGCDPFLIRERNVLSPADFPYDTGYPSRSGDTIVYDSGDYPHCLREARELIGYDDVHARQPAERARGIYRGSAVSLFLESTGMDRESARAELVPGGRLSLTVGSPSNGQSHATTMAQVCAGILGVDVRDVSYRSGDTAAIDRGTGTFGSRMAVMAGNAAASAATTLREQLLDLAAGEFEADPLDLRLMDGAVSVAGSPNRRIELADLARAAVDRGQAHVLVAERAFAPDRPTAFAGGAHAAIVDVDIETGLVRVEQYVVVHDCGTVINPTVVEGQIHGGVVHGLGNVLGERAAYDAEGQLLNGSFQSYPLPQAGSVPSIQIEHAESPSPFNPLGIKGAGEGGTIGALATVVAAVEDALSPLGLSLNDLPLNFEAIAAECRNLRA